MQQQQQQLRNFSGPPVTPGQWQSDARMANARLDYTRDERRGIRFDDRASNVSAQPISRMTGRPDAQNEQQLETRDALEANIRAYEGTIRTLQQDNALLKEEVIVFREKAKASNEDVERLKAQLLEKDNQLRRQSTDSAQFQRLVMKMRQEQDKISTLEIHNHALQTEVGTLNTQLALMQTEHASLQHQEKTAHVGVSPNIQEKLKGFLRACISYKCGDDAFHVPKNEMEVVVDFIKQTIGP